MGNLLRVSDFMNKPTNITRTDLNSWRTLMAPFTSSIIVHRNLVNKFNDKGRPEAIQETLQMFCVVTPEGNRIRKDSGNGFWSSENFKINYVYPDELFLDEIVESELYGRLKIIEIEDRREYGPSEATAVRINSIRSIPDVSRNNFR